jgi:hypothetical protein
VVASSRQLLGSRKTSRPRTNHRHALSRWRCENRAHPSFGERVLSNLEFNSLNGDWVLIDPEDTRTFARGGTQTARELREIVGSVEAICSRRPITSVDEVVPLWNEIAERTAFVAEGNPAVHAPARLMLGHCIV